MTPTRSELQPCKDISSVISRLAASSKRQHSLVQALGAENCSINAAYAGPVGTWGGAVTCKAWPRTCQRAGPGTGPGTVTRYRNRPNGPNSVSSDIKFLLHKGTLSLSITFLAGLLASGPPASRQQDSGTALPRRYGFLLNYCRSSAAVKLLSRASCTEPRLIWRTRGFQTFLHVLCALALTCATADSVQRSNERRVAKLLTGDVELRRAKLPSGQQPSSRDVPSQASSRGHNAAAAWDGVQDPTLAAAAEDSEDPTLAAAVQTSEEPALAAAAEDSKDPTPAAVSQDLKDPTLAAAAEALGGSTQAVGSWRLFLVGYDSGNMEFLRAELQAAGAHVVSYVPDDTWLVAGAEAAVMAAAWNHGAQTAPYSAQHKVSPTLRVLEAPSGLDAQAPTTNPPGAPNTTHEDADGRGFNVSGGSGGGVAAPNPSRRSLRSANSATAAGAHDKQNPVDANRHVKQGSGALAARHQLLKSMNSFHSTKNGNGVERKHFSGGGEPGRDVGGGFNEEEQRKHQPTRGRILEEGDGNARLYGNGTAGPNAAPRALLYELEVEVLPAVLTAADLARAEEAWPGLMAQAVWGGDGGNDGGSGLAAAAPAAAKAAGCWPVVRAPRDHDGAVLGGSVAGGTYLLVGLCEQDLVPGYQWLSSVPLVAWVAPRHRGQNRNLVSSTILQTGDLTLAQFAWPNTTTDATERPYRYAGLTGEGEVVGVGDTGFDLSSCYLADPRVTVAAIGQALASSSARPLRAVMAGHRKVLQYVLLSDVSSFGEEARDDPYRFPHGTHVSTSVAGARLASLADPYGRWSTDAATGSAPKALLSLVDMVGYAASGAYSFPLPVLPESTYFPLHMVAGASITSDSWGSADSYTYSPLDRGYDLFLWRNPNVTSFVAAGNTGYYGPVPGGTVASPGLAKNVVAVGATDKVARGSGYARTVYRLALYDMMSNAAVTKTTRAVAAAPAWGQTLWLQEFIPSGAPRLGDVLPASASVPFAMASISSDCAALASVTQTTTQNAAIMLDRTVNSYCSLAQVHQAAVQAGALALILWYDISNYDTSSNLQLLDSLNAAGIALAIPVSVVDAFVGSLVSERVRTALSTGQYGGSWLQRVQVNASIDNTADFSAAGPTVDGRWKPDIVAPGVDVLSAVTPAYMGRSQPSGDTCHSEVSTGMGTSMATPLSAGHSALIRQYLRSGFYPTGQPTDPTSRAFSPSGILVKALALTGAKDLAGGVALQVSRPLGPSPDGYQGWGRLSLRGTLPLRGYTHPDFALQLLDGGAFDRNNTEVVVGGVTATGTGPVAVGLAWYDYPASPNAARTLVNDLDLAVLLPTVNEQPPSSSSGASSGSSTVLYGNNPENSTAPVPDRLNTYERVLLSSPPAGQPLAVRVRAANLRSLALSGPDALLPTRWAVVVVGHVRGTLSSTLNPAFTAPS